MEPMTEYHVIEFRFKQTMSPSGAWEAFFDFYMPRTLAAIHRLRREFEAVRVVEGEDPPWFLGRVGKATDRLDM